MRRLVLLAAGLLAPGFLAAAFLAAAFLATGPAHAASPQLTGVYPRGVQRGQELTLSLVGNRLADAREMLFYQPGIQVLSLRPRRDGRRVVVRVRVAADCRLGEHLMRVRTESGLSELQTLWIGALPVVRETEPNNRPTQPQRIALDTTVQGRVRSEDVDCFAIQAIEGQRVSVEVEGMRLGGAFFDPHVSVLDTRQFVVASSDDTALFSQDPHLSFVAPATGRYIVRLRESAYGGRNNAFYRLHVGRFPQPVVAYPAGGPLGKPLPVTLLGDPRGPIPLTLTPSGPPDTEHRLGTWDLEGRTPTGVWFRPSSLDNVLETEPNANHLTQSVPFVPGKQAANGIIDKPGDVDWFRFDARKGQAIHIVGLARRLGSPLDPVVLVYAPQKKTRLRYLAGNDDAGGPDSYLRFTPPADGTYYLRISDHRMRGGPTFVYRIESAPLMPRATLGLARVGRSTQIRQTVSVPQGNRYAALVDVGRLDFGGAVQPVAGDLPKGVTVTAPPAPRGARQVPVLFEASLDAPLAARLARLDPTRVDGKQPAMRGGFTQRVELVLGPPNRSIYHTVRVDRLAVAVTRSVPLRVDVIPLTAPLVRNGSLALQVTIQRPPGFTAPIQLRLLYNPPGVSSTRQVRVPAGASRAVIGLTANGNAPLGAWPVCVVATARVGDGNIEIASGLTTLKVAPPFVSVKMQRAAVQQGRTARLTGQVKIATPFEGQATATLVGLPPGCTARPVPFDRTAKQLAFDVVTPAKTKPGRYKNVVVQVRLMHAGAQVVHRWAGRGELRVDPPPRVAAKKPAVKKAPPKPATPRDTPLSRLEKLRQGARERAEQDGTEPGPTPGGK